MFSLGRRCLHLVLLLTLGVPVAPLMAQSAQGDLSLFEAATVKPVPTGPHSVGLTVYPGGRLRLQGFPLKALIATAFSLKYWQLSGGEKWAADDEYDVEVIPSEKVRAQVKTLRHGLFDIDDEHLREMLQAVVIDRFHLTLHRTSKAGDVYVLARSGKDLALKPAQAATEPGAREPGNEASSIGYSGAKWSMSFTSMPQLARFASAHVLLAPVTDETQLDGLFQYRQQVPDDDPKYGDRNEASFQRWIGEMGLTLRREKGKVEVFIIDYAEKPTPN